MCLHIFALQICALMLSPLGFGNKWHRLLWTWLAGGLAPNVPKLLLRLPSSKPVPKLGAPQHLSTVPPASQPSWVEQSCTSTLCELLSCTHVPMSTQPSRPGCRLALSPFSAESDYSCTQVTGNLLSLHSRRHPIRFLPVVTSTRATELY